MGTVGSGVEVGTRVSVGVGNKVGVGIGFGIGADVGVGIEVGVGVNVGISLGVGIGVSVGSGMAVGVTVGMGVGIASVVAAIPASMVCWILGVGKDSVDVDSTVCVQANQIVEIIKRINAKMYVMAYHIDSVAYELL